MQEGLHYLELISTYASVYGLKLIGSLIIFIIGKMIARWVSNLFAKVLKRAEVDETLGSFLSASSYFILLLVVILAAVSNLGVETTSFVAILASMGVAVGLALKDSISNVGAAVLIIIFRPFKVGDFVEAGGASGTVEAINMFSTTICPLDNRTIIVPNSSIIAGNITNFSMKSVRRVDHTIGISYDDDIKKAKEVMYDVIKADSRTLHDPEPLVAVKELGDSSVNFTFRAWVKSEEYWDAYFSLIEEVKYALDEAGISIPYPQMDIHLDKQNQQ